MNEGNSHGSRRRCGRRAARCAPSSRPRSHCWSHRAGPPRSGREHNEVSDLAYDGIDVGWGWGANDPGGSTDYKNRGLYDYQPVYTSPTTLSENVIRYKLIHGTKKVFHDSGSLYNLSASPGTVMEGNYIYDNHNTETNDSTFSENWYNMEQAGIEPGASLNGRSFSYGATPPRRPVACRTRPA
ncbi:hypothetical protein [Streptomyces rhizosphaericus]|uniref:hypothetical protein n=1 Tax=Streptomyces rhizosphaericus TaxID=114699 RepID=UPI0019D1FA28|nr:hypothetical protein [Streptomyces rhizosphaericus]